MINRLFKRWIRTERIDVEPVLDKVDTNVVSSPEGVKDIREPVYSFVNFVKRNKGRFHTEMRIRSSNTIVRRSYIIKDLVTGETFDAVSEIYRRFTMYGCFAPMYSSPSHNWLTGDEVEYVIDELTKFLRDRKNNLDKLKNHRLDTRDRLRLMKIYGDSNDQKQ